MATALPTAGKLVEAARLLNTSGLNAPYRGVLAARSGTRDTIFMTAAKTDFSSIDRQDICLIDTAGAAVNEALARQLPVDLKFYLKVFQDRADIMVLAHLYPPFASVFADRGQLFELSKNQAQSPLRELIKVECRECPSRFTGLCSCRSDIRTSYAGADALLIKQDGIVVLADNLPALFLKAESLEQSAHKAFTANSVTPEPSGRQTAGRR